MPTTVDTDLWVGDESDCILPARQSDWDGIVHAAKFPCHAAVIGYDGKTRLSGNHPEYLWADRPGHLVLNMIDPPVPLFRVEMFVRVLDYLDTTLSKGPALIHCNQGLSRAPSLALVYLAKRRKHLRDESFAVAQEDFLARHPGYLPGAGLVTFLTERWKEMR